MHGLEVCTVLGALPEAFNKLYKLCRKIVTSGPDLYLMIRADL